MFTYSDIPEDVRAKPYFPLMPNIWQFFREQGWDRTKDYLEACEEVAYDFFEDRLNTSILTSKAVLDGTISPENASKVLSYIVNIPPLTIRSDLVHGTTRLLGGDSFDVTWVALHDISQEVFIFLNAHCEDGVPVDWWIARDDEILDRRHMKLGYKIREMPHKLKSFAKLSERIVDIAKDIRNERTPEWSTGGYVVAPVWVSYSVDLYITGSNYETMYNMWYGWAAKAFYGLPDYMYYIYPFPGVYYAMFRGGPAGYLRKTGQLINQGHLYLQPIEERTYQKFESTTPELTSMMKKNFEEKGVPFPVQSINATMPNLKSKDPNTRFQKKYLDENFIKLEDVELPYEEARKGLLLDITADTLPSEQIDRKRVISMGIGKDTKFL